MVNSVALETELRRNVIDRLINASLNDATPVREATLQRWRTLKSQRSETVNGADVAAV